MGKCRWCGMSNRGRASATEIKKLPGGRFHLQDRKSKKSISFEILSQSEAGRPIRAGGEAYGVCAVGREGDREIPAFLKIFRHRVPLRDRRNRFLATLGLANRHWLFRGVPFGFLTDRTVKGIELHGNLSLRIRSRTGEVAPTVGELINHDRWTYSREQRARFCGQICCAVHALEGFGLVHGDISLGNVLIGWEAGLGEVATLVDYDGFYHPKLPPLPLKLGKHEIRRVGSPGFQAPLLLEEIEQDAERACVRSDRMALAALVFQLMVWEPEIRGQLGREQILEPRMTRERDLASLPPSIRSRWPEGFELLSRAFHSSSYRSMPSPRAWLGAVGGPNPGPPVLRVSNHRPRPPVSQKVALSSQTGDFAKVHAELSAVSFRRNGHGRVLLEFSWQAPVIQPSSRSSRSPAGRAVELGAGDVVSSNFWKFEVLSIS